MNKTRVETPEQRKARLAQLEYQRHYSFTTIWTRRYAEMKSRVEGRSTNRSHSFGKELLSKEDFIKWCTSEPHFIIFMVIYMDWVRSGFNLMFAPSVDRVNSKLGYTADNMQWLTFVENCEKNNIDPVDFFAGYMK